jgi:hypothetical protein
VGAEDITAAWLAANWRANLQDFIMNQPFSIAISFIILWSIYRLQVVNSAFVARLSTLRAEDGLVNRDVFHEVREPSGKALELSVEDVSGSQKQFSISGVFSSKKTEDKYAWTQSVSHCVALWCVIFYCKAHSHTLHTQTP